VSSYFRKGQVASHNFAGQQRAVAPAGKGWSKKRKERSRAFHHYKPWQVLCHACNRKTAVKNRDLLKAFYDFVETQKKGRRYVVKEIAMH
jgi:hypothetical protein